MADREKLINELANDIAFHCPDMVENGCGVYNCASCLAERLADDGYHKAVQKWIPVTERLPQEDEPLGATCEQVQLLLADSTVTTGWCNRFRKLWYHLPWGDTHFYAYPYEHTPVIAWQPLAEPPKGE